ncbi:hypothetical protein [Hyphococcus sp.]
MEAGSPIFLQSLHGKSGDQIDWQVKRRTAHRPPDPPLTAIRPALAETG